MGGVPKGLRRAAGVGCQACWVCVGRQCQCPHENILLEGVQADGGVTCRSLAEKVVVFETCRGSVVLEKHCQDGLVFDQLQGERGIVRETGAQELIPGLQPGVPVLDRGVGGGAASAPVLRGRAREGGRLCVW